MCRPTIQSENWCIFIRPLCAFYALCVKGKSVKVQPPISILIPMFLAHHKAQTFNVNYIQSIFS